MTDTIAELGEDPLDGGYPPDDTELDGETTTPVVRGARLRHKALAGRYNNPRAVKRAKKQQTRILAREKQRRALELRKVGATYEDIAQQVGYAGASGAYNAVKKAMTRTIQEPATELRVIEMERLNHMMMMLWPKIQNRDETAINTALRVMDKIDRLNGIDAGAGTAGGVSVTNTQSILVIDGNQDEFIAAAKKMAGWTGVTQMHGQDGNDNQVALPVSGPRYPPGMDPNQQKTLHDRAASQEDDVTEDIVDAEIVEPPQSEPSVQPAVRKYAFGVDPLVQPNE